MKTSDLQPLADKINCALILWRSILDFNIVLIILSVILV